jgi:hypothetical protein
MDYSNYPTDHINFNNENKAKLGFFKNEFGGTKKCTEFVGLRAKCYCFNFRKFSASRIYSIIKIRQIPRTNSLLRWNEQS